LRICFRRSQHKMSKTVKNNKNQSRKRSPKNNIPAAELAALRQLVALQKRSAPPPKWMAVSPYSRSVRFGVVANQSETDFVVRNLLYMQCLATSTVVIAPLAYSARLRKVWIWFQSPTLGTNISSTIEWNDASTGFLSNGTSVSETNSSTTDYVCLSASPPNDTLASWYSAGVTGATNVLFSFSAPAGATMQIDYDWVPGFTEAVYETQATTGVVSGTLYCRAINANVLALPPLNSAV
jgi:hypothetical protein